MNSIKLLDCTLRDGAYLVDKDFGSETVHGLINGLLQAKIDVIEIGFLQDTGWGIEGKTVYKNAADAMKYVPKNHVGCDISVLADFSRYSVSNLEKCNDKSFNIIRECFFKAERFEAMKACKEIKRKGYKLYVQPVDILGYTDQELLELLELVNDIQPETISIVDTFGSMYQEDLHRIFLFINHNLLPGIDIGFHSHNNLQLSNALSQEFIRLAALGDRNIVIDSTICGMGRGAGNTPTELIVQYMNTHMGYHYGLDSILDIIDSYFGKIFAKCEWGYSIPYFIAGINNAHVNNISYLLKKNSIRSRDIRYILNHIDKDIRKRYDYDLMQQEYIQYVKQEYNDELVIDNLKKQMERKNVLLLLPGNSIAAKKEEILNYINDSHDMVIAINFIPEEFPCDLLYFSNVKRYEFWLNYKKFSEYEIIITSNIEEKYENNSSVHRVSFNKLIKCGWNYMDNSAILCLRLMDILNVKKITIAGFDGFSCKNDKIENYYDKKMELDHGDIHLLNQEIAEMLKDYIETRKNNAEIKFLTSSKYERILSNQ